MSQGHSRTHRGRVSGWLTDAELEGVRSLVPVLCVELVPVRAGEACLIERRFDADHVWCFAGGRVRLDEPVMSAVERHAEEVFGVGLASAHLVRAIEYQRTAPTAGPWDPRQHAVSLLHRVRLGGRPRARGEADDLRWFSLDRPEDVPRPWPGLGGLLPTIFEALGRPSSSSPTP